MAAAAEHAVDSPILAWLILVAPKLFTAYCAMNDLLFAEDVQVKLLHTLTYTKMYMQIAYWYFMFGNYHIRNKSSAI